MMVGMGSLTLIGQVCSAEGLADQVDRAGGHYPSTLPAVSYLRQQAPVPVLVNHDPGFEVGRVTYLERSKSSGLLAVAQVRSDMVDMLRGHRWFLSDGVLCRRLGPFERGFARLAEVSLVGRTASIGTRRAYWSLSDGQPDGMPVLWRSAWDRALEATTTYAGRRALERGELRIHDVDPLDDWSEVMTDPVGARRRAVDALPVEASPVPLVRVHGTLLDAATSSRVLDLLEFGWV